jgi:cyclopropane fatty-acyl-phospholipid synthase-like methyltransferase
MLLDVELIVRILLIIFLISISVVIVWFLWPNIIGAPWIPTPRKTVRKMLELAQVNSKDTVMDLGSGDGRIIVMAAKEFGARSIGIEADPGRVLWSRLVIRFHGLKNRVEVIWGNFFHQPFTVATVVTIFQLGGVNERLKEKLLADLNPGSRVISHAFRFDEWELIATMKDPDLYLYEIP